MNNESLLKKAEETIYKMRDLFGRDKPIMGGNTAIGVYRNPYKSDIERVINEYEEYKKELNSNEN